MGFHGYGHASCIIGDYCLADCSDGPQVPYYNPDSVSYSHSHYRLHPNRTIVPQHRNDGPVDLSLYCTPTGRGTWSIGGQRAAPPPQIHPPIQATSNCNLTGGQLMIESLLCATSQKTQTRATSTENAATWQLAPEVDALEITSAGEYAKHDRNNNDSERAELERKAAALLNMFRAIGPSPVCHEHSNGCANVARIIGAGKASEFSKSMASSQRAIGHRRGIYGIDTTVTTAHGIARDESGISDTSDLHSGSTAFSRDGGSGQSYVDSFSAPNSCCESEDEIHEAGKQAV